MTLSLLLSFLSEEVYDLTSFNSCEVSVLGLLDK